MNCDRQEKLTIKSGDAEFLMFEKKESGESIEVRYENETLWLTQKSMAALFDVSNKTVSEHLSNVFSSGELDKDSTVRKFRIVQTEGIRQVTRNTDFYSLDAVISVGYRINSVRATQFRRRATKVLNHSECVTPECRNYTDEFWDSGWSSIRTVKRWRV